MKNDRIEQYRLCLLVHLYNYDFICCFLANQIITLTLGHKKLTFPTLDLQSAFSNHLVDQLSDHKLSDNCYH